MFVSASSSPRVVCCRPLSPRPTPNRPRPFVCLTPLSSLSHCPPSVIVLPLLSSSLFPRLPSPFVLPLHRPLSPLILPLTSSYSPSPSSSLSSRPPSPLVLPLPSSCSPSPSSSPSISLRPLPFSNDVTAQCNLLRANDVFSGVRRFLIALRPRLHHIYLRDLVSVDELVVDSVGGGDR